MLLVVLCYFLQIEVKRVKIMITPNMVKKGGDVHNVSLSVCLDGLIVARLPGLIVGLAMTSL